MSGSVNRAEEVGVPPEWVLRREAYHLRTALRLFVVRARQMEWHSHIDAIGFAFVLQETARFQGLLTLIDAEEFFCAEAILRGLWESYITFKHLFSCCGDVAVATNAYGLLMDYNWAEKARKSSTSDVAQSARITAKADAFRAAFAAVPVPLQNLLRSNTADMCARLDSASPRSSAGTWSYQHEYDAVFRRYSDAVHGGLQAVQPLIDVVDNSLRYSAAEKDDLSRGYLGAGILWTTAIVSIWGHHASEPFSALINLLVLPERHLYSSLSENEEIHMGGVELAP